MVRDSQIAADLTELKRKEDKRADNLMNIDFRTLHASMQGQKMVKARMGTIQH